MANILSWNIHTYKGRRTNILKWAITEIVNENKIDIVVLQEAFGSSIFNAVNAGEAQFDEILYPGNSIKEGVRIFIRKNTFDTPNFIHKNNRNKLMFVKLKKIKGSEEFNIAAVHLHSKVGNTERQQLWKNRPIFEEIKRLERLSLTNRTILVGDFNHNPYDNNLCDPDLIDCKGSKSLISVLTSNPISKKRNSNFWYNPMWNLLGDYDYNSGHERITGTFFRYTEDETPIWNLLDGFILRPSIMNRVDYTQSAILKTTNSIPFLKPFTVKKDESIIYEYLSDHLPIKFSIAIN